MAQLTEGLSPSITVEKSCKLILQLVHYYQETIMVIDALDECDMKTRGELLDAFEIILRGSTSLVKIFVSSRDNGDIKCELSDYANLEILSRNNSDDIQAFIKS